MQDGYIIRGHRHKDCIRTAREMPRYSSDVHMPHGENQGFITSLNRFVDRKEGLKLQLEAGKESYAKKYGDDYRQQLYSEDLY